ncbi:hypothetical protein C5Y96_17800 [Blastopirellula marina]|uniref:Uncharacterized protein n=1 Tax=Blastopirellula marina TaxID=124 RepID=A0A2S8F5G1_9BACT|nr:MULTISPECIES: hypothetical protein [Pirellulaceae]PQO27393.1 hypothetical protein C5Y96_17800 [Blastopirellula marina]RCS47930.1 hypothetical protein DTL36_17825 [Bremerella cremea]
MTYLTHRNSGNWIGCLLVLVAGWGLFDQLPLAAAQEADGDHYSVPVDSLDDDARDKVYTSPQSILADFFGKRRAGMVVNGLEDLVGITATGLSPLMVLSIASPVVYFMTEADRRQELIFLYQPWFFIPIILITLLMAFKDTVLTFASYLKMPLDILGILFHLMGFLLGFRLIYHFLDINLAADSGPLGTILTVAIIILMFAFYTSVWVLSNVFEVLILINPFPLVDTFLRVSRIGVLLVMYVACWIHPALGGIIALPILIVSLITFERSLRTMLLGFRLAGDVILFRSDKVEPDSKRLTAFASFGGTLPWMTLGKLVKKDEIWTFTFRRFSIGPTHSIAIPPGPYSIAKGSLFPGLLLSTEKGAQLVVRFPASYRGQEEALAQVFQTNDIQDFRLSTMAKSAWNSLWKSFFRRSPKPTDLASE